jgi:hypothetical protein
MDTIAEPKGKVICVDLDNTLCTGHFPTEESTVIPEMKLKVWEWYTKGAIIIIWTARQPIHYSRTLGWLIANEIPFTALTMRLKPAADLYIDDRALNVTDIM